MKKFASTDFTLLYLRRNNSALAHSLTTFATAICNVCHPMRESAAGIESLSLHLYRERPGFSRPPPLSRSVPHHMLACWIRIASETFGIKLLPHPIWALMDKKAWNEYKNTNCLFLFFISKRHSCRGKTRMVN